MCACVHVCMRACVPRVLACTFGMLRERAALLRGMMCPTGNLHTMLDEMH